MVSAFGKFLRNLRMDVGELLLNMAEKLDVTPAFLSGVENGKKKIPSGWVDRISALYHLNEKQRADLQDAFFESNKAVEIGLDNLQAKQKNLLFSFARKLESISEEDAEYISRILNKENK
ncbi:MAG: helix-turn-helix domain-containing protein [Fibrobacteraceae bacterium]|nr:helix-turn-helix domain-containing protein [Fibrobacteraceae bacterium]